MARYLIAEGAEIVSEVTATSIKAAVEGLRAGLFTVYTLQGHEKTVFIEEVTEARVTIGKQAVEDE